IVGTSKTRATVQAPIGTSVSAGVQRMPEPAAVEEVADRAAGATRGGEHGVERAADAPVERHQARPPPLDRVEDDPGLMPGGSKTEAGGRDPVRRRDGRGSRQSGRAMRAFDEVRKRAASALRGAQARAELLEDARRLHAEVAPARARAHLHERLLGVLAGDPPNELLERRVVHARDGVEQAGELRVVLDGAERGADRLAPNFALLVVEPDLDELPKRERRRGERAR